MALGGGPSIGLDIGTSAVRAARLNLGRGKASLVAFGQVALPPGAVVEGEIQDPGQVSEAIAQLWKRAKIGPKKAVIGVANQRVVVRQVDLPFMDEKEFRASLRFQVADQIPMPVEEAELDFQVLEDYMTETQEHMMRVLLVAAATDMIESFVSTVNAAGIEATSVDLTPFAVARAVSPAARGDSGVAGAEAVVDVGAGVTNIIVHHNGEPRFVRILLVGGDAATTALSTGQNVSIDEAEAAKLDLSIGSGSADAQKILKAHVDTLVSEIRGSLDYYLSQEDSQPLSSVILTGGGSLASGLIESLEQALRTDVQRGTPLAEMNVAKSGLTDEQIAQVEPVAAAAVGLAMGAPRK
ncbi:MAG: type IV pilus assembly protein PilM [Actinomycetota bacterium]